MIQKILKKKIRNRGIAITAVLVFAVIAIAIITGLTSWFAVTLKVSRNVIPNERAFQIAEAGIDYYEWHLAHDPGDYMDGTGVEGPYVHDFFNKEGNKIGEFVLTITPPEPGTKIVTIRSEGSVSERPDLVRTVEVKLLKASIVNYAFLSNSDIYIRTGAEIFGAIHSNGGIRFDGIAHNLVTSSKPEYDDPYHSGAPEFGVHTHISPIDPLPPSSPPEHASVFQAGRDFPVPAIDFEGITLEMALMRQLSQEEGLYFPKSNKEGYRIVLKTDDTFDLYIVNKLKKNSNSCKKPTGEPAWNWTTWSIEDDTFISNNAFPQNGLIYFEDHLWVEGQIDTARITIVAGRFPESDPEMKNIIINNDLLYTNTDGSDVIGLIAQHDIGTGLESNDVLNIDAVLVAKNGRVGRPYYEDGCAPYHVRDTLNIFGAVVSYGSYGFAYSDGTGYANRIINYDPNLQDNAPPYFPTVSQYYQVVSWEEIE